MATGVHFHQGDLVLRRWVASNLAASAFGISGGVLNNIVMSRLYRAGSVAYVSTSGGMSNELNTVSRSSSGVFECVAIGGKRELGSRFFFLVIICFASTMHLAPRFCCFGRGPWFGWNPWKVAKLRNPRWCVGTCACCFCCGGSICHADAQVGGDLETAASKKQGHEGSLAFVPDVHEVT